MTLPHASPVLTSNGSASPGPPALARARAYCGPAHGYTWCHDDVAGWPARVVLESHAGPQEYRLVHDLRARRPARDDLGNTLYMPATVRTAAGARER